MFEHCYWMNIFFFSFYRAVAGLNGFEFQDRMLKVDFANNRPPMNNNNRRRMNGQNQQQNRQPEFPMRYPMSSAPQYMTPIKHVNNNKYINSRTGNQNLLWGTPWYLHHKILHLANMHLNNNKCKHLQLFYKSMRNKTLINVLALDVCKQKVGVFHSV